MGKINVQYIYRLILSNYMEKGHFGEDFYCHSADFKITSLLCNPNIHYRFHTKTPMNFNMSHMSPVHRFTP